MIEPDRILQGICKTLEEAVLPSLGAGYARGQLFAVLEVLASLEGQLRWGGPLAENEAAMLASLVADAATAVGGGLGEALCAYAADTDAALEDRLRTGRHLVCRLIDEGHADGGPLVGAVSAYLANDAIMRAMALRPGRLAEISQG